MEEESCWAALLGKGYFVSSVGRDEEAASLRGGREFALGNGWSIEPQVELKVVAVQWGDFVDAGGKQVTFDDDVLGRARVGARLEKLHVAGNGARVRYWTTLGLQDTFGEKDELVGIGAEGAQNPAMLLPNHQLGLTATLDIGVEAELRNNVSLFGVLSLDQDVNGSDFEQRGANLGLRVRW